MSAINQLHHSSLPGFSFTPVKLLLKGLLTKLLSVMPDNTFVLKAVGCKVYRTSKTKTPHTCTLTAPSVCGRRLSSKRRLIEYRISLMKIKYFSWIFKVGRPKGSKWHVMACQEAGSITGKACAPGRVALLGTTLVSCHLSTNRVRRQHLSFSLPSCVLGS